MPGPETVSQLAMASCPALILGYPGPYMANSRYCSTEGFGQTQQHSTLRGEAPCMMEQVETHRARTRLGGSWLCTQGTKYLLG